MVLGRRHDDQAALDDLALTLLNVDVANEGQQHNQQHDEQHTQQHNQQSPQHSNSHGAQQGHSDNPGASDGEGDPQGETRRTPKRTATGSLVAGALLARRQREAAQVQAVARDDSVVRRKAQRAKAGKRRQRRWQNNVFLKSLARRLAEDSGVDPDSREFAAELRSTGLAYDHESPLDTLFKDWRSMQRWLAFDKLPAREQQALVEKTAAPAARPQRTLSPGEVASAQHCYARISRHIRNTFSHGMPSEAMVERMEAAITAHFALGPPRPRPSHAPGGSATVPKADADGDAGVFALPLVGDEGERSFAEAALAEMATAGTTADVLEVAEENAYQRLVLHAVCQYHALQSHSVNARGTRVTRIRLAKAGCEQARPALSLASWMHSADSSAPGRRAGLKAVGAA